MGRIYPGGVAALPVTSWRRTTLDGSVHHVHRWNIVIARVLPGLRMVTEISRVGTWVPFGRVTQLVVSEYRRARILLHDDLLFGAKDVAIMEAWRLQDDLDTEDCGGSWITDARNADLVGGTHDALLRQIEQRADLRRIFTQVDGGEKKAFGLDWRAGDNDLCVASVGKRLGEVGRDVDEPLGRRRP